MSEAEVLSEEYGDKRNFYVEKIRQSGNDNLANILENATPQEITKDGFIDGLVTSFPEYKPQLEAFKEAVEDLQEQEKEAYDYTQYFREPGPKKFVPKWLADDIEEDYDFKKVKDSEQLYVFKDGYYQAKGQQIVQEECEKRLGEYYRQRRFKEVLSQIESRSFIKRREFTPPSRKINLDNGVYDLEEEDLIDHDPEFYFTHKVPVKYNPKADCPNIHEFLSDVVETEAEEKTLREIAGYCLLPDYPVSKAFMLLGKGSNGKSRYLDLVRAMVGQQNIEEKGLQQLEENRFATAQLEGKLSCVDDDLDSDKLKRTSTMKKLTGGSRIGAEIKYGGQFSFENYAKLLFACNELPRTADNSDGFYRRWILVEFPYKFKENPDSENPKEKQGIPDKRLKEKILDQEELEGFLWWSIEALKDVLDNDEFTHAPTTEEARQKWREYSTPLVQFIENFVDQGKTYKQAQKEAENEEGINEYNYDYVRKDFLAEVIGDYCEARSHSRPSKKKIRNALDNSDLYFGSSRTTKEPESRQVPVYSGLKIQVNFTGVAGLRTYSDTFRHACAGGRVESSEQSVQPCNPQEVSRNLDTVREKVEEAGSDGISVSEIAEEADLTEYVVEEALDQLSSDGQVFESQPDRWCA
jgi:P4 family phage/plasmid primase-like protien